MKDDLSLSDVLLNNKKRQAMLWSRDRRLQTSHDPYDEKTLLGMYRPYLENFDHKNLSPREVRLLETVIDLLFGKGRDAAKMAGTILGDEHHD